MKAIGLTGVTAAGACGLDDNRYRTPVEDVLPYVVKPEQVTPGTPTFFATSITSGPTAYPVLARHRDGRVINVESNRKSGMAAAVPKSVLLELQRLYSPDRYRGPVENPGGADKKEITWDDGISKLTEAVKAAKSAGKQVAYLGPYRSGSIVKLIGDYTSNTAVYWEPVGYAGEASAWKALFGTTGLPQYDISEARYVLSFGAAFLGGWGGSELQSQYAEARNPNNGHFVARFALVSPHMDQGGANADDWYPCKVGSQTHLAFAIAKLVADKNNYTGNARPILDAINLKDAIAASGVSEGDVDAIAAHFSDAETAVALPGITDDGDLSVATALINLVSGNGGKTFKSGGYTGPIHGSSDVASLIEKMKAGKIGVLLLDDTNPAYSLPTAAGFSDGVAKVDMVVGLSSHPDESNALAHVILPTSSSFEDWGDEEISGGRSLLRQPAMTNLWDTRSLGDILLASAKGAGLTAPVTAKVMDATEGGAVPAADATAAPAASTGFDAANWKEYLQTEWLARHGADWRKALHDGVYQGAKASHSTPEIQQPSYRFAPRDIADGTGIVLYLHPHRYDGRYANQPWSQEVADPMSGHVWGSWVEVSPDTFDASLSAKAEVEIKGPGGALKVGAVRYRGLAPNTVAIALGQGHVSNGRYANNTGVNAFALAGNDVDSFGNILYNGGTGSLAATGGSADLVSTFGQETDPRVAGGDGKRDWGVSVNANELEKHGDKPASDPHHVGALTGIHHFPRDPRLEKAGELNFYDEPDHPNYRFGMTVDTNACNGCGACVIACYAENNLPIVGKSLIYKGREMNWLRINRYWEETKPENEGDRPQFDVQFVPMMCQHCAHAPCESVCPVLATYHNVDGLNAMIYNRCVGTRYCANNCPYVARRFNFHTYKWPEPFNLQLNPEISVRTMGVMEKCTFCVQRIRNAKIAHKGDGFTGKVPNEDLQQLTACADACPSQALTFGDKNDSASTVSTLAKSERSYVILAELNTFSAVNYLAKASFHHHNAHGAASSEGHDGPSDTHQKPSDEHHEGGH